MSRIRCRGNASGVGDASGNCEESLICVYVIGAVKSPGVALVPVDSRIYEVIEKVGGFTEDADKDLINLAMTVKDEEKIIVPFVEKSNGNLSKSGKVNQLFKSENSGASDGSKKSGLVNINTASKEELKSLSGIGDSTADKIIDYRENTAKFKRIEDLKNVSGIGDAKFNAIKSKIEV